MNFLKKPAPEFKHDNDFILVEAEESVNSLPIEQIIQNDLIKLRLLSQIAKNGCSYPSETNILTA